MLITKRVKDLPEHFSIPNRCKYCGLFIGFNQASSLWWVTDGTTYGTEAFCCKKCAKSWMGQRIIVELPNLENEVTHGE